MSNHFEVAILDAVPDSVVASTHSPGAKSSASRKSGGSIPEASEADVTDQSLLRELIRSVTGSDKANVVSADLIQTFGTLSAVLQASEKRLRPYVGQFEGILLAIRLAGQIATRALATSVADRPLLDCAASTLNYLRFTARSVETEAVRVLYLDGQWRLLSDEVLAIREITNILPFIPEIARRAVTLQARALVFVHIRPDLELTVDTRDLELFENVREMCDLIHIAHGEHLLVSRLGAYSFLEDRAL